MRRQQGGFTLIEVMLVVILMAGIAVAAVVMIPTAKDDHVEKEAQRLFQLVRLLGEQAILSGTDYGIWVGRESYEFRRLDRDGWQPMDDSGYFTQIEMGDTDIRLALDMQGFSWEQKGSLFKPGSLFDEDMFRDEEQERANSEPQILVMASGEMTPFSVDFEWSSVDDPWRVVGNELGHLTLLAPGEELENGR